ncbi:sigma-70 family RNA polymerase sigma factor [Paenibacillus sp. HJGM_3]|uniref:sigma-70 family RNA polymerase sigma factor n=1 Tax=Paenibacillus sp. HJGM_3 TaxID=3379816 RepID=UPI00385FAB40
MEQNLPFDQVYTTYKPLLFALAYRMLGSVMDAEDAVQEAFLHYNEPQPEPVRNVKAYLCRVVTNRAIDRLRSASKQREVYVGPWLPEPLVGEETALTSEPAASFMLKESVSTAYLLLLQQLSWVERAVFILREVLQYEYEEIAEIVDKSPANCRQIFHRAKRSISGTSRAGADAEVEVDAVAETDMGKRTTRPSSGPPSEPVGSSIVERFVQALHTGNLTALMELLTQDAVLQSDGGGKVTAAIRPILGADRIARFLLGVIEKVPTDFRIQLTEVNGYMGIVGYDGSEPINVISFQLEADSIAGIYLVLNPDKLQHIPGGQLS